MLYIIFFFAKVPTFYSFLCENSSGGIQVEGKSVIKKGRENKRKSRERMSERVNAVRGRRGADESDVGKEEANQKRSYASPDLRYQENERENTPPGF